MDRIALKEKAKKALTKERIIESFKLIAIYFAISLALSLSGSLITLMSSLIGFDRIIPSLITSVASILVSGLLGFGMISFFLKMSRDEEVTYKELFAKTDLMVPYIVITLVSSILIMLGCFLLVVPGIILSFAYSFIYLIFLDNPEMKPLDTLKKSREMLNGHKMDMLELILSFLGWYILGAFTLGILYIWVIPYMSLTVCYFYDELKAKAK